MIGNNTWFNFRNVPRLFGLMGEKSIFGPFRVVVVVVDVVVADMSVVVVRRKIASGRMGGLVTLAARRRRGETGASTALHGTATLDVNKFTNTLLHLIRYKINRAFATGEIH